jgi:transposase
MRFTMYDNIKNTNTKDILFRTEMLENYLKGFLTEKELSGKLNITERHARNLIKKYKEQGKVGLLHNLRGKVSNHSIDRSLKEKVLKLTKEKYFDFGPTLLSEQLIKNENIKINIETLRLWLKENKLINKLRKRKPYRTKRERKEYFGEMLQIDGSFHEWFISSNIVNKEDRKACLINLIDDNTNTIELMFDKQETTKCASLLLWKWIQKYGIPQSIYCDRRNMYITEKDKNKEKTELNNPKGYFRQMCDNLNIQIIEANSPQAKGRVERGNKTHQDRLIKLMRLKNITNIEEANKYLEEEYVKEHNEKFASQIMNTNTNGKTTNISDKTMNVNNKIYCQLNNTDNIVDIHKKLDSNIALNDICYVEEVRKLRNDWTISFKGKWYQLKRESQYNVPTKSTVYVRLYIDGAIGIFYRNHPIKYEEIG